MRDELPKKGTGNKKSESVYFVEFAPKNAFFSLCGISLFQRNCCGFASKWCSMYPSRCCVSQDGVYSIYGGPNSFIKIRRLSQFVVNMNDECWVPCIFELESKPGKAEASVWTIRNTEAAEMHLNYAIPLPPQRGTSKLYLSAIRVGLHDADGQNHIFGVEVRGIIFNKGTVISDTRNIWSNPQRIEIDLPDRDCSVYDTVKVVVHVRCTIPSGVDVSFVSAKCYYR